MPPNSFRQRLACSLPLLEQTYPQAHCALHYATPYQLLVATILSAQCTDVRVNQVTPSLFRAFPDAGALARADVSVLEEIIRPTGFFRNKARNLIACADQLCAAHGGEVPQSMEALVKLPGVGRKTANVVLGNAFGIPGMVVDTHVKRVAYRLGWTTERDPERVERDLRRLLRPEQWTFTSHLLIAHGRALCKALKPLCSSCPLFECCPRQGVKNSR